MARDLTPRKAAVPTDREALAAAIGAYVEAMEGTGVDLDEDFEAAAWARWTALDEAHGDRAAQR